MPINRIQHAVADCRPEGVQIWNPHPRKRTAERRFRRHKQCLQLWRAGARRLPDLAAAHPAALASILRVDAAGLAGHRGMLRRLLVRQALHMRYRVRMAELRILRLACLMPPLLAPGCAAPAIRGSSAAAPGPIHPGQRRRVCNPRRAGPGQHPRQRNRLNPKIWTAPFHTQLVTPDAMLTPRIVKITHLCRMWHIDAGLQNSENKIYDHGHSAVQVHEAVVAGT